MDPTLVDCGTTKLGTPLKLNKHVVDADKVIIIDGITTHLFAGFGGGRKLILPGVSGFETISAITAMPWPMNSVTASIPRPARS